MFCSGGENLPVGRSIGVGEEWHAPPPPLKERSERRSTEEVAEEEAEEQTLAYPYYHATRNFIVTCTLTFKLSLGIK